MSLENENQLEESASQLSAMFDGELSAAECELLSRRLGRDDALRARWARYAMIGAALRSEPVTAVTRDFSRRVGAAIEAGDTARAAAAAAAEARAARAADRRGVLRTLAGGGAVAAGVAAVGIFALRLQVLAQPEALTAFTPTVQRVAAPLSVPAPELANTGIAYIMPAETLAIAGVAASRVAGAPRDYVVPPSSTTGNAAPAASLASYVVAHSEYSSPLVRGGLISRLMVADDRAQGAAEAGEVEVVIAGDGAR